MYKGSALWAADAARYAPARKNTTKCEGGRKKRPMIWCEQRFDNAKSYTRKLIALCCAVCFLAMSRSDQQYECNLQGGGGVYSICAWP